MFWYLGSALRAHLQRDHVYVDCELVKLYSMLRAVPRAHSLLCALGLPRSYTACSGRIAQALSSVSCSYSFNDVATTRRFHQPLYLQRCFSSETQHANESADGPPAYLPVDFVIPPRPCRVVLIGWLGASNRLMSKYAQMYRASGHNTVLYVIPTMKGTIFPFWGRFQAEKVTEVMTDFTLRNPGMPTIVHVFSGAGFIFASSVFKHLYRMDDLVLRYIVLGEVSAIIFDSCPAEIDEDMASRAVVAALFGQNAAGVENRMGGLVSMLRSAFSWWMKRDIVKRRINDTWRVWEIAVPPVPQLYLYSETDVLIPAKQVELFQERQQNRGVHVFRYKWSSTPHVEHFRHYPTQYASIITQFLSRAIKPLEDDEQPAGYIELGRQDFLDNDKFD